MKIKCKSNVGNFSSIIFINPNDIKKFDKNGLIMKRKYGKLKREIFEYKLKN